jgi:hypothetical protein
VTPKKPCTFEAQEDAMYRPKDRQTLPLFPELFPLGGGLRADNRWVRLGNLVPWGELEDLYRSYFSAGRGRPAKDARLFCGLLIVKHVDRESDEGVVGRFAESPYVQWFCGYDRFVTEDVIDPSLLSKTRRRLGARFFADFEEKLIVVLVERKILKPGSHLLDATVVPANVEYPTDVKLLGRAREWLVTTLKGLRKKLDVQGKIRTYCRVANLFFVNFQKKRRKTRAMVRLARGKMLRFVRRNLRQMEEFIREHGRRLSERERAGLRRRLDTIRTIYAQQFEMWKTKAYRCANRIVSLHLPHVRPVVRGKDGKDVEFGPKALLSWTGRFAFLDKLAFEVYNEGSYLGESLAKYKERFGKYPKDSTGDGIFGTRDNRGMLKELKIKGGFKALGRGARQRINRQWFRCKQALRSSRMEGLIGNGKNHYGLDRILYTIPGGEEIWTRNCLMAMNLVMALRIMTERGMRGERA